jgi:hypothetical protein
MLQAMSDVAACRVVLCRSKSSQQREGILIAEAFAGDFRV